MVGALEESTGNEEYSLAMFQVRKLVHGAKEQLVHGAQDQVSCSISSHGCFC